MWLWKSVVGKLWSTIILLVALVLALLGAFLLPYIDMEFTQNSSEIKHLFIIVCIIGFSLTTFFALFLSFKITRPLVELKRAASKIAMGEYRTKVNIRSSDEIGELAQAFNQMGEKLESTITDLNYEKEHLSGVLASMTDAVITFRANGEIISFNPQGEHIIESWGTIDANEKPNHYGKILPMPLQHIFETVVDDEKEVATQLNVGTKVWSVVMTPLYTAGTLRGAVAVLRDVTQEVNMEKMRRLFVANVSHELRTPLSMLQGYTEALLDGIASTPEERDELVQVIHDESLRMGRLVQDLLDLAGIEAGHLAFNKTKVDVYALLQRMVRKFAGLAREAEIDLKLEVNSNPVLLVLQNADEDRMEQVLTNLLDNAIRHTPSGKKIYLRAERRTEEKGDVLMIEIEDHGYGIPEEDVPYVFDRFYKADKSRKRAGGTGLGLAIVKNIVEAHEGTVSLRSKIGQGTTFTVKLPVATADASVEKRR